VLVCICFGVPTGLEGAGIPLAPVEQDQFPRTGSIRGTVVDSRDGTPVRRVSVRLQSSGRAVITDDEGRFAFEAVPVGEQELYVSVVDFILVKRNVTVDGGANVDITIVVAEGSGTYSETVDVRATTPTGPRRESTVAAEQILGGIELQQLRGLITNDPLRAVQVLPAVAAGDDLRSEFAIRGAGPAQMNFTFEGISSNQISLTHYPDVSSLPRQVCTSSRFRPSSPSPLFRSSCLSCP
jgi:hypothetical protein